LQPVAGFTEPPTVDWKVNFWLKKCRFRGILKAHYIAGGKAMADITFQESDLMQYWQSLIATFQNEETELHTMPITVRTPRWFTVVSYGDCLYVSNAKQHKPSCTISDSRRLSYTEFARMYPIYLKRKAGQAVSKEATAASRNQVYWYPIMKHCNL
jgi:hypothetical protein